MISNSEQEEKSPVVYPRGAITPEQFFTVAQVGAPDAIQCFATWTRDGGRITDNGWCPKGTEFAPWVAAKVEGHPAMYYTPGAYDPANTRRFSKKGEGGPDSGRTGENSLWFNDFGLDIDGGPYKWAEHIERGESTDGLYQTAKECSDAAVAFMKASKMLPTFVVETGSGGVQLHYLVTNPIRCDEWRARAARLVELTKHHGLKIDAPVTTNAAGLLRAPGSIHQKSGKVVRRTALELHLTHWRNGTRKSGSTLRQYASC